MIYQITDDHSGNPTRPDSLCVGGVQLILSVILDILERMEVDQLVREEIIRAGGEFALMQNIVTQQKISSRSGRQTVYGRV